MRYVMYRSDEGDRAGVVVGDAIHALPTGLALIDVIGRGAEVLHELGQAARQSPAEVVSLAQAHLLAPIERPPVFRDALCYLDHVRNYQEAVGQGRVLKDVFYRIPAFAFRCPTTILGPFDDAPMAPGTAWQDFELEIGAIVGVGGKDLTVSQAQDAIIGYTIVNDWSARDLQALDAQMAIGQAKGKDSGITLGPYLVTPDDLEPYMRDGQLDLTVTAMINDTVIGTRSTAPMDWSFAEVISFASRGVPIVAGEVFGSGTVPVCTLLEHFRLDDIDNWRGWLRDGDVVTLTVEGLGQTRQTVRASHCPEPLPARVNPDVPVVVRRPNPLKPLLPFTHGLHEVGRDVWAWIQPDGGYGLSNAGLIAGDNASMLIDTLYDLQLTRAMLDAMVPITSARPITTALFTHANGDHCYGNQLLDESVNILAAAGSAEELAHEMNPQMMAFVASMDLGPVASPWLRERFGGHDWGSIAVRNADQTFDTSLTVEVGSRTVELHDLGPAHTTADTVAFVPDAGVLFTGDLVFAGSSPIVWAGPISNWVAACERMIDLGPSVVIPGHGPVVGVEAIRAVKEYWEMVIEQSDVAFHAGLPVAEAVHQIDLGPFKDWLDAERIVNNVYVRYRELDPDTPELPIVALLTMQADWDAKHRS